MWSLFDYKVLVTFFTRSCHQIVVLVTCYTWSQIFCWERLVWRTLFNRIVLILQILQFVINRLTVTVWGNPILSCIVVGPFIYLLALMGFLYVLLLTLAVCALSCTHIKYLSRWTWSTLVAVLVERLVIRTLLNGNFIILEFLNLILVFLLIYGPPNIWIFRSIHIIQVLRNQYFLSRVYAVMIELQKDSTSRTLTNALVLWQTEFLLCFGASRTLAIDQERFVFVALDKIIFLLQILNFLLVVFGSQRSVDPVLGSIQIVHEFIILPWWLASVTKLIL